MGTCQIEAEDRGDVCRFVEFPNHLYKGNSYFCPALEADVHSPRSKDPFPPQGTGPWIRRSGSFTIYPRKALSARQAASPTQRRISPARGPDP